jgi:hypothetical protein
MPGGTSRARLANPCAFAAGPERAIQQRTETRAPQSEHLGPVAGDD